MSTPYLGEIRLLPYNFAPRGWAFCDGSLVNINSNAALYSLLGVQYGGNGQTTFALPDLRGRVPIHRTVSDISQGSYVQGAQAGTENVTLTLAQMPGHTHAAMATTAQGTAVGPGANGDRVFAVDGNADVDSYAPATAGMVSFAPTACTPAGGGQPHDNMQPYTVLNYCIATQGIYPPRQ